MPLVERRWFGFAWPFAAAAVGVVVAYLIGTLLSGYFIFLAISAITATIAILGLGVVTGTAGMIALCQLTFAAVGAWVVSLLNVNDAPGGFLLWLLLGGLAAGLVGAIVGLPALRLRGVNLAVVTLGLAAAFHATLMQIQFPGSVEGQSIQRPDLFSSDREFYLLSVIVLAACCVVVIFMQRGNWGSSWKAIAFSEHGTAAAGHSVSRAKLSAFAVSAALGGISGGLLAGQVQLPFAASFTPIQSLALYILAIMSGARLIDMAIFGGVLWVAVPELLKRLSVPLDWGFVIFGVLGVQALTSGTNLGEIIRNGIYRRADRRHQEARVAADVGDETSVTGESAAGRDQGPSEVAATAVGATVAEGPPRATAGEPVLTVSGLTVQFGTLKALDDVSLEVPANAIVGLIGPNGAGKSTFVDTISGFVSGTRGQVRLGGRNLAGLSPSARARIGLRRTFQQDRVPPTLTVGAYVRFVARRKITPAEVNEVLEFFGCPPAAARLSSIDVGRRRLVEVAAQLAAKPKILILDEPAAGLSHDEHITLAHQLQRVPERFGVSMIIIEHDLDLVRSVCTSLTMLNFGEVLASGSQDEVLNNPEVIKAYMGETELQP